MKREDPNSADSRAIRGHKRVLSHGWEAAQNAAKACPHVHKISIMTYLAIDHSSNLEDGLYTGEEVCAVLGGSDGIAVGIDHIGKEIELDPDDLSLGTDGIQSENPAIKERPQHNMERPLSPFSLNAVPSRADTENTRHGPLRLCATDRPVSPRSNNGRALAKRPYGTRLHMTFIKRQLLANKFVQASTKIKAIARLSERPPPFSPTARQTLLAAEEDRRPRRHKVPAGEERDESTGSTCAMSHASLASSSTIGSSRSWRMAAPSTITTSTCDFRPEPNTQEVFERCVTSNPWEAAERGDYAVLAHMIDHEDRAIWTQRDEHGRVPLYYACVEYGRADGRSFGKYGLESVKLLVDVWPADREYPEVLLDKCRKRDLHEDVLEVLEGSGRGWGGPSGGSGGWGVQGAGGATRRYRPQLSTIKSPGNTWRVEGVSEVNPVSFLEDLGDDGYVEDY
ncbi:hypothetical protein ACHAWF_017994 [Thalassiosira exigua]